MYLTKVVSLCKRKKFISVFVQRSASFDSKREIKEKHLFFIFPQKMSQICYKCKNVIKDVEVDTINCNGVECLNVFHRHCVDIVDDKVYEAIQTNALLSFLCSQCDFMRTLVTKMANMEDKMNKLNNGLNAWNVRCLQQSILQQANYQFNGGSNNNSNINNNNSNNNSNNLIVIGNNTNLHRLQVVCDYGRWVQVGKFATITSEEDIIEHLSEELKINRTLIKCTKLVKNDANLANMQYCKFKISIPDYRFTELFNEAIWPCGVMVSHFTPRSQMNPNRII